MRNFVVAMIAATSLLALPAAAGAAPCRDAKGKFIKCPPAKPAAAATPAAPAKKAPCRDAKGKFTKCTK